MAFPMTDWISVPLNIMGILTQTTYLESGEYDYFIPPPTPPLLTHTGEYLPLMPGSPLSDACFSEDTSPLTTPLTTFPSTSIPPLSLPESLVATPTKTRDKKRGHLNRAKKRKQQAEHGREISHAERQRHVQTSEQIPVPMHTEDIAVADTGYLGLLGSDTRKKDYALPELVGETSRFKMTYVPYNGSCVFILFS